MKALIYIILMCLFIFCQCCTECRNDNGNNKEEKRTISEDALTEYIHQRFFVDEEGNCAEEVMIYEYTLKDYGIKNK